MSNKEKPFDPLLFVGNHPIAKMSKMMKGHLMKNPILSKIDEDEVAVAPAADTGPGHITRWCIVGIRGGDICRLGVGRLPDLNINECAEAFIRRFRQQLQLQPQLQWRHSMGNLEKSDGELIDYN